MLQTAFISFRFLRFDSNSFTLVPFRYEANVGIKFPGIVIIYYILPAGDV